MLLSGMLRRREIPIYSLLAEKRPNDSLQADWKQGSVLGGLGARVRRGIPLLLFFSSSLRLEPELMLHSFVFAFGIGQKNPLSLPF